MTLPYKLALMIASLALCASVWSRFAGADREEIALVDRGAPSGDVEASPPETAEPAEHPALVKAAPDPVDIADNADRATAALPTNLDTDDSPDVPEAVPGSEPDASPTPEAALPPTLTVGRDPFDSVAVALRAGTQHGSHGLDPGEPEPAEPAAVLTGGGIATPLAGPTYTVRPGDTFEGIAKSELGGATRWVELAQANPLVDPRKLRVGQVLRLPQFADAPLAVADAVVVAGPPADPAGPSLPPPPEAGLTHTVRAGDSLSTIANRYYGDSSRWRVIFDANQDRIGQNPDAVKIGMELLIPPADPASTQSVSR